MSKFLSTFLPSVGVLQVVAFSLILVVGVLYAYTYFFGITYPADLPRFGGGSRFSLRTRLLYYTDCRRLYHEAYEQYSKKGKTCLIPGLGVRSEIIIPPTSLKWLVTQPDKILSTWEAFHEIDQIDYVFGEKFIKDPWQGMIIKREMNKALNELRPAIDDELKYAYHTRFGHDQHAWKELNLYRTMQMIVAQASSRFTVGLPLCRNEEYLRENIALIEMLILNAGIMGGLPKALRPIAGRLIAIPMCYRLRKIKEHLRPLFNERMKLLDHPRSPDEPKDHFQMILRYAQSDRPEELNLDDITIRVVFSNFGSFHQTSMAITIMIFNILRSNSQHNTIAKLRQEASKVVTNTGSFPWSKAAIANMFRTDSLARETLRLQAFGNRATMRKVMVDNLRTEDGILLPRNVLVSILSHPAQVDEDVYEDALEFDPFRFSRSRESTSVAEPESDVAVDQETLTNPDQASSTATGHQSFIATGVTNLPFGHGRHACPGRYILDVELKMLVAYLITNYDFELPERYLGKVPDVAWVAEAKMPPTDGIIRVKRR